MGDSTLGGNHGGKPSETGTSVGELFLSVLRDTGKSRSRKIRTRGREPCWNRKCGMRGVRSGDGILVFADEVV